MIEILVLYFGCTRIESWLGTKGARTMWVKVAAVLAYCFGALVGAPVIEALRVLREPYSAQPFSSGVSFYLSSVIGGVVGLSLILLVAFALRRSQRDQSSETNILPRS